MKLLVFLLLSLVSLLADMTYEGGRSISGPYLEALGASLLVAGSLSAGELVAHSFRSAGGFLAQKLGSKSFWPLLFLGYSANLAIPALAFVQSWEHAFLLYMIERAGKGLRAPLRDALIAEVSAGMGRGRAFALHELLDQLGAVAGPLAVALLAARGYSHAMIFLAVPAALSLALLFGAYYLYPAPQSARAEGLSVRGTRLLFISMGLAMASLAHWGQASYVFSEMGAQVAFLYAIAMALDGLLALPMGAALDRYGLRALSLVPTLALLSTLSLFYGSPLLFALLWGAAMAAVETLPRAAVALVTKPGERGAAYSLLYFYMGLGWAAGNVAMSFLGPLAPHFALLPSLLSLLLLQVERKREKKGS
ncbi:MAG: MFS transporter [Acidilobaceae archaeon]|nr:MFS transporter [Acidilobaceae archaeon]